MLAPLVRRSWAPRGQTPILHAWDRRDRLSVISALTLAPNRRRLGLHFDIFAHNIHGEDIARFVRGVRRRLRRGIILVLDRWSAHRSAARQLLEDQTDDIVVEWLPPYAPDLNPTEQVWNHTKRTPTWPTSSRMMLCMNWVSKWPRPCSIHDRCPNDCARSSGRLN